MPSLWLGLIKLPGLPLCLSSGSSRRDGLENFQRSWWFHRGRPRLRNKTLHTWQWEWHVHCHQRNSPVKTNLIPNRAKVTWGLRIVRPMGMQWNRRWCGLWTLRKQFKSLALLFISWETLGNLFQLSGLQFHHLKNWEDSACLYILLDLCWGDNG